MVGIPSLFFLRTVKGPGQIDLTYGTITRWLLEQVQANKGAG